MLFVQQNTALSKELTASLAGLPWYTSTCSTRNFKQLNNSDDWKKLAQNCPLTTKGHHLTRWSLNIGQYQYASKRDTNNDKTQKTKQHQGQLQFIWTPEVASWRRPSHYLADRLNFKLLLPDPSLPQLCMSGSSRVELRATLAGSS